jgi:hypothetical protein
MLSPGKSGSLDFPDAQTFVGPSTSARAIISVDASILCKFASLWLCLVNSI